MSDRKPREWTQDSLPTDEEGEFPREGDYIDCATCVSRAVLVDVGREEGCGFCCDSCGNQLWCWSQGTEPEAGVEMIDWEWEKTPPSPGSGENNG